MLRKTATGDRHNPRNEDGLSMSRPSSPVDPSSDGVKEISDGGILSVEEAIGGDEGLKDWMGLVDLEWGKQTVEDGELPGSQVSGEKHTG
ncbi:hypothetical protein Bca52824_016315 [Brassica carinata]|uniref:Uncharacterized protein n=1 Tax=Brassica carinata TaxID=52824 RepID=A0A8X7W4V3_BRACI|nr:hypothetical protein Bca52824_016315 [Brassica carinata]